MKGKLLWVVLPKHWKKYPQHNIVSLTTLHPKEREEALNKLLEEGGAVVDYPERLPLEEFGWRLFGNFSESGFMWYVK